MQSPVIDVRLVLDGQLYNSGWMSVVVGRVEVSLLGVWGTVCKDYFDTTAATVVCGMFGYKE